MVSPRFLVALLFAIAAHSTATEVAPAIRPIATTVDAQRFSSNYCQAFFIRKESGDWVSVPLSSANLKDDSVERLRGCINNKADRVITTATFALDTQGLCEKGRNASPRSKGYFLCNSNFANRGIFGAMKGDAPFDQKSFDSALDSNAIKAAAHELVQAFYQELVQNALNADESCGECAKEVRAIRSLFDYFYSFASGPDLENLAVKYVSLTGIKKLPDWATVRLSPSELDLVAIKGEQAWRSKYEEQAKAALDPNSDIGLLQRFISERKIVDANNWKAIDFSNLLPKAQQLLQIKEDADRKERAAAIKRIEAELRINRNSDQLAPPSNPMADCIRRYRDFVGSDQREKSAEHFQGGMSKLGTRAIEDSNAEAYCKRALGSR
jgi:hypothetical protein